ncbi:cytochrome b561 [Pseudomonas hunanensis]|uniref:Cytochrome b561 n=1 Tax=Pseudomonas hunanensis TaxID=1247546 RepID=A0ACC6JY21_9PSED|nr:cytochrome b [Pseudomonas hunanensis]MDR6711105.1 cytochrome b561 [Pseudomonas hunanensis]
MNFHTSSYTSMAKLLHWLTAVLWLGSWFIGIAATHWREELNAHHELTFIHKAIASTILLLTALRVFWVITHPAPPLPSSMRPLAKRLAHLGHMAIYLIALIALPVSGWYWSSVADKPIMIAGLFQLPPLVAPAEHLYGLAKAIHTYTSWLCGMLISGHVILALKHHYVDRDGVLKRMLPGRS